MMNAESEESTSGVANKHSSFIIHRSSFPSVAVVGGGLAGLAAAAALCQQQFRVELFESRRQLGGRAGSFVDPATQEIVDHCQHVSMGCCTNLADFCRRTQIEGLFRRDRVLHFFAPDGRRYGFAPSRWLPPPLHLAPAFLRLGYLSWSERRAIGRAMRQLAAVGDSSQTAGDWLREHGQSPRAIEYFWSVVLTSALGEVVDRASIAAARKVFVDGFLGHRAAQDVIVPTVPLAELYDQHVGGWLTQHGVTIHLETPITQLAGDASRVTGVVLRDGTTRPFDFVVLAVPWRRVADVLPPEWASAWPALANIGRLAASPITAAHLWFDRPITRLPHAVLIGRLSQWLFAKSEVGSLAKSEVGGRKSEVSNNSPLTTHYYQIVISGSHDLAGRDRESVIAEIERDLQAVFPEARDAKLLRWRLVTDPAAVFSVRPGVEQLRPPQRTPIPGLMLAGDWTATGWPATMEGAVRSGYLAAEEVLRDAGRPARILVPDLPRSVLARLLL